jgi:hypothetical protein
VSHIQTLLAAVVDGRVYGIGSSELLAIQDGQRHGMPEPSVVNIHAITVWQATRIAEGHTDWAQLKAARAGR